MSNHIINTNKKYQHPRGIDYTTQIMVFDPLVQEIKSWAYSEGYFLDDITLSGSRAKGTAISLTSDLDMFISLSPSNTATLKEIFNSLFYWFNKIQYSGKKQNVSIQVTLRELKIDLVPGKRQNQHNNDHSIYKSTDDTWMQTNVNEHINIVKYSSRISEIVAAKIWRHRHNLPIPSILLELITIEALKYKDIYDHDRNFLFLLEYIRDHIETIRVIDPANTNNIISNDITINEKYLISDKAGECRNAQSWAEILW